MMKRYIVTTKIGNQWVADAIGLNEPRSYEECERNIRAFKAGKCGETPDWTEAEYRIEEATP